MVTCGKLGEVRAAGLAQAANMEVTLALITQDHGAVTEGAHYKVRLVTDVALACIMVWLLNFIPAQHSSLPHLNSFLCLSYPENVVCIDTKRQIVKQVSLHLWQAARGAPADCT